MPDCNLSKGMMRCCACNGIVMHMPSNHAQPKPMRPCRQSKWVIAMTVQCPMSGLGRLRLVGGFNHQVVTQFTDVALVVYPSEIQLT